MSVSLQDQLSECNEARKFEQQTFEKQRVQLQTEIERQQVRIEAQRVEIEELRCLIATQNSQIASLKDEITRLSSHQAERRSSSSGN